MKKLAFLLGVSLAIFISANMAMATQTFTEDISVPALKVGAQGVGGVTFFNGTIINTTTDADTGADMPVTFGDNVRIDGRVFRGASAGTDDDLPFIVNDNMEITGSLTVDTLIPATISGSGLITTDLLADSAVTGAKIGYLTVVAGNLAKDSVTNGKILDGTITAADLASNSITSAKIATGTVASSDIADGTIAEADLADNAVTTAKISNGSIYSVDLATNSVTNEKIYPGSVGRTEIGGTTGTNIPVAYGLVYSGGTCVDVTENVSCTLSGNDYEITIDNVTYERGSYYTIVTLYGDAYLATAQANNGKLIVNLYDVDGTTPREADFNFVTYSIY